MVQVRSLLLPERSTIDQTQQVTDLLPRYFVNHHHALAASSIGTSDIGQGVLPWALHEAELTLTIQT
jgi:hypothetical protein